ncbi:MAG: Xaa-Pro peptidase family protein [Pseudomonadota bacterium]
MPKTAFDRAEYVERLSKTKGYMAAADLDLLIVSQPENMDYLSGYANQTYPFLGFIIVVPEDDEPLWLGRESTDMPAALLTSFMGRDRFIGYPESCHSGSEIWETNSDDTVESFLANVLAERGWEKRRIGLEVETSNLPANFLQRIQNLLPDATLVQADGLGRRMRIVKSLKEVEYIRQAGVMVERAMDVAIASIAEGARQCDTAAAAYQALISGTPEFGGRIPEIEFTVGDRQPALRSLWTDEPYRQGELASLELFANRLGYKAAVTRSVSVGKPSDFVANMMAVVIDAMHEASERIRPGITYGQVGEMFHTAISRHGYEARPGVGYSFNDWGDDAKAAWLAPGDDMVFAPNHIVHMIPIMRMENGDWSLSMSSTLRVMETGAPEQITSAPNQLIIKA